jgi:hypothetical protein
MNTEQQDVIFIALPVKGGYRRISDAAFISNMEVNEFLLRVILNAVEQVEKQKEGK